MESNGGLGLFSQKKNDYWQKNEKVWVTEVNYLSKKKEKKNLLQKNKNSLKTSFVVRSTEDDSPSKKNSY